MNQQELLSNVKQEFNLAWLTVNTFPQLGNYYSHINQTNLYTITQKTYEEFIILESLLPFDAEQEFYFMNNNSIAVSFSIKRNNIKFRIVLYCKDIKRVIKEYLQVNCEIIEETYSEKRLSCIKGA